MQMLWRYFTEFPGEFDRMRRFDGGGNGAVIDNRVSDTGDSQTL
jgi:hypothetical protein